MLRSGGERDVEPGRGLAGHTDHAWLHDLPQQRAVVRADVEHDVPGAQRARVHGRLHDVGEGGARRRARTRMKPVLSITARLPTHGTARLHQPTLPTENHVDRRREAGSGGMARHEVADELRAQAERIVQVG